MSISSSDTISNENVFQNSFYIAINIQTILYGIELLLYFKTIHIILTDRGVHKKYNLLHALLSSMMLLSVTVWVATQAIFGENMWLLHSDVPEGPNAYWKENISIWYMDWATAMIVMLQLMTDALMIYRCWIIWSSSRVIVVPIILWLATLALGFLFDWTSSLPVPDDLYTGFVAHVDLAYYSVSVFLNTTLTCMICYRMVRHGKMVQEHRGHEYGSLYFTVVMILVESVFPYTLAGIAFLVSLGIRSPTSVAFGCVYFMMMCISPQMLILRVVAGKALVSNAFKRPGSAIRFNPEGTSGPELQRFESNGTRVQLQTLSNVYLPDGHSKM